MKVKGKRLICVIFFVLFVADICTIIKYLLEHEGTSFSRFFFYKNEFSDGSSMYNMSIVYFVFVTIIYFLLNFFETHENKDY